VRAPENNHEADESTREKAGGKWNHEWCGSLYQEGIMTIQKRLIQRGVLWGLVLGVLVACSMIASPPIGEITKNDHAALAAWYDEEAAHLRQHAKDEMAMAEAYRKNPDPSTLGVVSHKIDMIQHCETLAGMYTKAAEEADQAAKTHRDMLKK
jgi:hypothetical protein